MIVIVTIGALFFLLLSFLVHWKTLVKALLYLVIFEGVLRKWIFPQAQMYIYFLKDLTLLIAYFKFFFGGARRFQPLKCPRLIGGLMAAIAGFCILQVANPSLGSPIIGLFGLRNYIFYMPLIILVGSLFDSVEELTSYLRKYSVLLIPMMFLATIQYFSPAESLINRYSNVEEVGRVAKVGSGATMGVRATGTFPYIGGLNVYLQFMISILMPLIATAINARWRLLLWICLFCHAGTALFSGSRGVVLGSALIVVSYFGLNPLIRALGIYRKFLIPSVFVLFTVIIFMGTALENTMFRFQKTDSLQMRLLDRYTSPIEYMNYSGIFGYGVGAAYQGTSSLRNILSLPPGDKIPVGYEEEPERIMLELGPIGFLLWYVFRVVMVVELWKLHRSLSVPLLRELALTAFLLHLVSFNSQVVFQISFLIYFWFSVGFILAFPRLQSRSMQTQY